MKICLDSHPECSIGSDLPLLPTRVLDVGVDSALDPSYIKVLETGGARGKYIALSHCWGDPALMPTKLTAHTLQEYQGKILYGSLPPTFRDAVAFTRKMEVQYIWIDSLCIIQSDDKKDSPKDKALSHQDWITDPIVCALFSRTLISLWLPLPPLNVLVGFSSVRRHLREKERMSVAHTRFMPAKRSIITLSVFRYWSGAGSLKKVFFRRERSSSVRASCHGSAER